MKNNAITGETLIITRHAYQRARQRLSLSATALEHRAAKAILTGLTPAQTRGYLHKYCLQLWNEKQNADNPGLHGDTLFLFAGNTLLRVWQIPASLRPLARVLGKKTPRLSAYRLK